MPKVKFLVTRRVKDHTGTTFEKGKVYDLPDKSCEHWKKRGVAEDASPNSKTSQPIVTHVEEVTVEQPSMPPLGGQPVLAKVTPEEAFAEE